MKNVIFFWIQNASLYSRHLLYFHTMHYLMLYPGLREFNHTSIMWEHCVTEPHLPLCFWGVLLQFKGVKLPWKQHLEISLSRGKENVYFYGCYALTDNVQQRVMGNTMKDEPNLGAGLKLWHVIQHRAFKRRTRETCLVLQQLESDKNTQNEEQLHSILPSL